MLELASHLRGQLLGLHRVGGPSLEAAAPGVCLVVTHRDGVGRRLAVPRRPNLGEKEREREGERGRERREKEVYNPYTDFLVPSHSQLGDPECALKFHWENLS